MEVVKDVHILHPEVKFVLLGVGYYSPELDRMKTKIAEYALEEVISLFLGLTIGKHWSMSIIPCFI